MSNQENILVTGGAGYIGSHTIVQLLNSDYNVAVIDNLSNSSLESINRIKEITNKSLKFYKADLLNKSEIDEIIIKENINSVIHFAGLKAVGESVEFPLKYYSNNIIGSLNLFESLVNHGVNKIVFSSSATVYGDPHTVPIKENFPLKVTNPYGRTKLMIEEILQDLFIAYPNLNIAILRYFNPVGAHKSGKIGEDPNGIPNNLMPFISQVAVGKRKEVSVFGNDYKTIDGTGVRDYLHVEDLANGHIKAIEKLKENPGLKIYNLGTGKGYSVLEMINAFQKISNANIPYKIVERREGDIAECYADPSLAEKELKWKAERNIEEMCEDSWRWQSQNPNGYK